MGFAHLEDELGPLGWELAPLGWELAPPEQHLHGEDEPVQHRWGDGKMAASPDAPGAGIAPLALQSVVCVSTLRTALADQQEVSCH